MGACCLVHEGVDIKLGSGSYAFTDEQFRRDASRERDSVDGISYPVKVVSRAYARIRTIYIKQICDKLSVA